MVLPEESIGFEIRIMFNLLRRKMLQLLPPPPHLGLTEMEYQTIHYLYENRHKDVFQKNVEEWFCIRRSTASRMLKGLEQKGILVRTPTEQDGRMKRLSLTQECLEHHEHVNQRLKELDDVILKGLTEDERITFLRIARKIEKNLS